MGGERVDEGPERAGRIENIGPWRSLVSALDWGSRGREFKSPRPDESHLNVPERLAVSPRSTVFEEPTLQAAIDAPPEP